jgi:hypothetical protein
MRSFINYLLHGMLGIIKGERDWHYGRYEGKFRGTSAPIVMYWMCEIWYRIIVRNSGKNGHVTSLDLNVGARLKFFLFFFLFLLLLLLLIKEIVFGPWIGFIWLMTISTIMLYSKSEPVKKLGSF